MKKKSLLFFSVVLLFLFATNSTFAQAVEYEWNESSSSWSPNLPATLPHSSTFKVNEDETAVLNNLTANNNANVTKAGSGALNLTGNTSLGSINVNNGEVNATGISGSLGALGVHNASVNISDGSQTKANISVGTFSSDTWGRVNIDGQNTKVDSSLLSVGKGELNISNGATVENTGAFRIGQNSGDNATVKVSGGSVVNSRENLDIAVKSSAGTARGNLDISGASQVNVDGNVNVGYFKNGNGTVTISGEGSFLNSAKGINIGYDNAYANIESGVGRLNLYDGGSASAFEGIYVNQTSQLHSYGGTINGDLTVDGRLRLGYSEVTGNFGLNVNGLLSLEENRQVSFDLASFTGWDSLILELVSYGNGTYYADLLVLAWDAAFEEEIKNLTRSGYSFRNTPEDWEFGGFVTSTGFNPNDGMYGEGGLYLRFNYSGELPQETVTPEPATILIFGCAIGGGIVARRFRKRSNT